MLVGVGRGGKTALANSIIGRSFADTNSTVGINQVTCDVKFASIGGGDWSEYAKPSRELEAALAQMIMSELLGRGATVDPSSHVSSGNAAPTIFVDDEGGVVDGSVSVPANDDNTSNSFLSNIKLKSVVRKAGGEKSDHGHGKVKVEKSTESGSASRTAASTSKASEKQQTIEESRSFRGGGASIMRW
jgi:hypothetical protein